MQHCIIYFFLVIICLTFSLNTINSNSIDNLMSSIGPSVFELSASISDEYNGDVNMISLDEEKFKMLLIEEIKNNKAFYQGTMFVEFYFYNVKTLDKVIDGLPVNGVQVRITFKAIYMLNKQREYRYEVAHHGG